MNKLSSSDYRAMGALTLQQFADSCGLSRSKVNYLAEAGLIHGVARCPYSRQWLIFPPAQLATLPKRKEYSKRPAASPQVTMQAASEIPDLLAGVDAVAVEAGTESRQSGQASPRVEAEGECPPADDFPDAFSKAQGACRALALASSEGLYPVVLSGRQVLLLERALSVYLEKFEPDDSQDDFGGEPQPPGCPDAEVVAATFSALRNVGRNRAYPQGKVWPGSMLGSQS